MRNSNRATDLSRRQFAALGAVAVAAAGYTGSAHAAVAVQENAVSVDTRSGQASAVFIHPAEGSYPGVVLWPDAAGLRQASVGIARELASAGIAVLMVDPYYRAGSTAGSANAHSMAANVDELHLLRDSKDFTAWLDAQDPVNNSGAGYVLANHGAGRSVMSASGRAGSAYLAATPKGKDAFTANQRAAFERAIHALDRLNTLETRSASAA